MRRSPYRIRCEVALIASTVLSAPFAEAQDARLSVAIPRADHAPRIDGVLNDPIWSRAARLTGFIESEPNPGASPKDSTIGFVAYDRSHLYIAVIARGSASDRRASIAPRDNGTTASEDDGITIRLDTFNDRRRAYVLQVNPRGVQLDGALLEGSRADMEENFVWDAAGAVTDDGYIVELSIPFSSLHFPAAPRFDIGFNIIRQYSVGRGEDAWAPRVRGSPCDICQQGTLTGITNVDTRRTIDFRPYVLGARTGDRATSITTLPAGGEDWTATIPGAWLPADHERRMGLDARVAVTTAYELNATLNPDFSQIEASPEQVRVNQRFALFYQEKRPFFTAFADAFRMANDGLGYLGDMFYSRDIVDPSVGVRLTGRSEGFTLAGLYAHDKQPAYFHYTGAEASRIDVSLTEPADVGLLRVRRNIGEDSYVGFMGSRRQQSGAYNQVLGADLRFRLGRATVKLDGLRSNESLPHITRLPGENGGCDAGYTRVGDDCVNDLYDGRSRVGSVVRGEVSWANAASSATISTVQISPDFRDQLGTFSRVGVQNYGLQAGHREFVRRFGLRDMGQQIGLDMTRDTNGKLLDYIVSPGAQVTWMHGSYVSLFRNLSRTTFLGTPLDTRAWHFKGGVRPSGMFFFDAFVSRGGQIIYDFADPRVGKSWTIGTTTYFRPTPGFLLSVSSMNVTATEPDEKRTAADADIYTIESNYQRTPKLGFRLYTQLSDQESRLIVNPFDQRDAYVRSSFLVSYEVVSTSFIYLGVNEERRRFNAPVDARRDYVRTGLRLFLKATYLVRVRQGVTP
jgi:hypothetical protein